MNENEIKALTPVSCPHCNETIIVEFIATGPRLTGAYTVEMIEAAKKKALDKIQELNVPEEQKTATVEWLKSPDTIFGPNDVDEIILNVEHDLTKKTNTQ